jgi:hypothetical protein
MRDTSVPETGSVMISTIMVSGIYIYNDIRMAKYFVRISNVSFQEHFK